MVLEALPDREVADDLDAEGGQGGRGTDAGQHQELRGLVGPRAEDHLALGPYDLDGAAPLDLDPRCPAAVDHHALARAEGSTVRFGRSRAGCR